MLDMATTDAGVVIALDVFDQFFKGMADEGMFPSSLDTELKDGQGNVTTLVHAELDLPEFGLSDPSSGNVNTELSITGNLEIRGVDAPPDSTPLSLPLSIRIALVLRLLDDGTGIPKLTFVNDGILDVQPDLARPQVEEFLNSPVITGLLDSARIDVVTPLIDGLEAQIFEEGNEPPRSDWSSALELLPTDHEAFVHSVAIFVARPGQPAGPDFMASPLPTLTEFGLIFARSLMDELLSSEAAARVGEEIDGAKIKRLSMSMSDTGILVDGHAEKDGADIDFDGPVRLRLLMGTSVIWTDSSDIDVDVDMPWYYYLGIVAAGLLFFIPVIGHIVNGIWLIPALADGASAADDAPQTVRGSLGSALRDGLSALADGLKLQTSVGTVSADSTTSHLEVIDGSILLFAQVFVRNIEQALTGGRFSKRLGKMTSYTLESGRRFKVSELARLVDSGKITVPRHHVVRGRYLRSNPDSTENNNLQDRFGG